MSATIAVAPVTPAAPVQDPAWTATVCLHPPSAAGRGTLTAARRGRRVLLHGTLFDRAALARTLDAPRDASDADLVLAAYERWGEEMLGQLRGSYAIVAVDETAGRAMFARDALGKHPLFYAEGRDGWHAAGHVAPLLALPGVSRALNRATLADHLCHRWPMPDETFFEHVHRVPPGCVLRIARTGARVDRYWDPSPLDRPIRWATDDEVDRFGECLDRAVERAFEQGQTGIFLSGGLDSISIAAVAADRAAARGWSVPHALSLGFPETACDERLVQTSVARDLKLPMTFLDFGDAVGAAPLLDQSLALNQRLTSPLLNTWAPAYLTLARRARQQGVRTIMTGSGGDEWLSISPYLGADLLRAGQLRDYASFVQAWSRSYRHRSRLRFARAALWTFGLRPLTGLALSKAAPKTWEARRRRNVAGQYPAWIAPDPALRASLDARAPRNLSPADPPHGFYFQEVRTGLGHPLTSMELEEQYQFGQDLGLLFHHPYWDADLVDLLYRTPPRRLNKGGRSKGLVRDTVAARFPKLGFDGQRKVVATSFYRRVLASQLAPLTSGVDAFAALGDLGVVDPVKARGAVRLAIETANPDEPVSRLPGAWDLVNVETWARYWARS